VIHSPLPFDAIVATERTGIPVFVPRGTRMLFLLQNALRAGMRYRGYKVTIRKHGNDAVRVWVTGRRG